MAHCSSGLGSSTSILLALFLEIPSIEMPAAKRIRAAISSRSAISAVALQIADMEILTGRDDDMAAITEPLSFGRND